MEPFITGYTTALNSDIGSDLLDMEKALYRIVVGTNPERDRPHLRHIQSSQLIRPQYAIIPARPILSRVNSPEA